MIDFTREAQQLFESGREILRRKPYAPQPPIEDEAYKRWIKSLPCCVCGTWYKVEAHHTGVRGLSQTADDRSCIPLCRRHHDRRQPHSIHKLGLAKFSQRFNINIPLLVARLSEPPQMRMEAGRYTAFVDGEKFILGTVAAGVKASLEQLRDMRRGMLVEEFRGLSRNK